MAANTNETRRQKQLSVYSEPLQPISSGEEPGRDQVNEVHQGVLHVEAPESPHEVICCCYSDAGILFGCRTHVCDRKMDLMTAGVILTRVRSVLTAPL